MSDAIRLQKYLSRAGVASRREGERLMQAGRVRVNGSVATRLGVRVVPGRDVVEVDGAVVALPEPRWVAFHKPPGVLTTRRDPHGGPTIYDVLPEELGSLRYVGRLDRDTEGLILLTNEGDVANGLQHPSGGVEREYLAEVRGPVEPRALARLVAGVALEDGPARAASAVLAGRAAGGSRVRLVLTEGRKREVRRMLEAIGHPVVRLRRERFGPITLGALESGAWRDLGDDERAALEALTDAD